MDRKSTQTAIDWLINHVEKDNDLDLYVTASAGDNPSASIAWNTYKN
ncbi:MAG: hypothetical protein HC935_02175 [Pseudanabaena sp. SU_2_4]|nr:hypothetical protein [Pseudanabaena sp. SU_2_4]